MATSWDLLVEGQELEEAYKLRSNKYIEETVDKSLVEARLAQGWEIKKENKNTTVLRKEKPVGEQFENEVWCILKKMGFKVLNKNNQFKVSISSDNPDLTKQIDIVAIDDETCLLVECKAASTLGTKTSFKTELESMDSNFPKAKIELSKKYPGLKFKTIFATKNYVLGDKDQEKIKDLKGFVYFDYDTVDYYHQLVEHLGAAAKYQLLGNLFAKQDIKGLDVDVPAIKSQMGGLTYYAFTIEPEKLLKIAYILHRNNANHDLMPAYQRLIKKDRLNDIRKFINDGGYFPNSIIISLDVKESELSFSFDKNKFENTRSKIGVLHLPRKYQTAYVIDGQHRLYGYSGSNYEGKDSIPVVAFVNLDKNLQVKMFMDINEKQKKVSKTLRNTLNMDLLWNAEKASDRKTAVVLSLAEKLGEDSRSPLYGRVILGENSGNEIRTVTNEFIKAALLKTSFFNEYKKNSNDITVPGYFDKNDNDKTHEIVFRFLVKSFDYVKDYCADEWNKNGKGYITTNIGIYGLITIFGEIVDLICKRDNITVINDADEFVKKCEPFYLALCDALLNMSEEEIKAMRSIGEPGKKIVRTTLIVALHRACPEFTSERIEEIVEESERSYNSDVIYKISKMGDLFLGWIKDAFANVNDWLKNNIPVNIKERIVLQSFEDSTKSQFDFLEFKDIYEIVKYKSNWTEFFKDKFATAFSNQVEAVKALMTLSMVKTDAEKERAITKQDRKTIDDLYEKFIGDE